MWRWEVDKRQTQKPKQGWPYMHTCRATWLRYHHYHHQPIQEQTLSKVMNLVKQQIIASPSFNTESCAFPRVLHAQKPKLCYFLGLILACNVLLSVHMVIWPVIYMIDSILQMEIHINFDKWDCCCNRT